MDDSKTVKYRAEDDILYINLGGRSHESLPRGGFILDLDSKGRVVGVEVLDASEVFESLDVSDVKEFLNNLVDGDVVVKERMGINWVILKLHAVISDEKVERTFRFEVPAPDSETKGEVA